MRSKKFFFGIKKIFQARRPFPSLELSHFSIPEMQPSQGSCLSRSQNASLTPSTPPILVTVASRTSRNQTLTGIVPVEVPKLQSHDLRVSCLSRPPGIKKNFSCGSKKIFTSEKFFHYSLKRCEKKTSSEKMHHCC